MRIEHQSTSDRIQCKESALDLRASGILFHAIVLGEFVKDIGSPIQISKLSHRVWVPEPKKLEFQGQNRPFRIVSLRIELFECLQSERRILLALVLNELDRPSGRTLHLLLKKGEKQILLAFKVSVDSSPRPARFRRDIINLSPLESITNEDFTS